MAKQSFFLFRRTIKTSTDADLAVESEEDDHEEEEDGPEVGSRQQTDGYWVRLEHQTRA